MKTFKQGVHVPDHKALTNSLASEVLPLPPQVVIPLSQHIGAPAACCVNVGERVLTGQVIGKRAGFVSVNVHASLSGTVKEIKSWPHPLGHLAPAVVIDSDGLDEWSPDITPRTNAERLKPEEIREILAEKGIVGLGGATFPTHVKLAPPPGKKIEVLLINGVECEPYLTADHRLMLENPQKIHQGIKILMQAAGVSKAYVGIEANKPDAIAMMTKELAAAPDITVVPLALKYPQGAEKQLIKAILNREVPAGGLPLDVGVVVNNVGTAAAVAAAVLENKPLISRLLTVTGEGINQPRNLLARVGTSLEYLLNFCGGLKPQADKILMGGPMMGLAQYTLAVPVIKGTSGITVLPDIMARLPEEKTCIRCGSCVDACPMFINPSLLGTYARFAEFDTAARTNVLDCIECGCCAFVCPAKIPLVHLIRYAKGKVLAKARQAAKPAA